MKIELLGTGGYFANSRRQTACVLLPEWGIIFDAGSGLYRFPDRCKHRNIQLFLTHPHLDHIVGLPFLLMPILSKQVDEVRVHAVASTLAAIEMHLFNEAIFPVPIPFQCEPIPETGSRVVSSGVTIRWQKLLSHPGGSIAYRVDADFPHKPCSMAYITDTTVDGSYFDFIQGVDLLLHECYFSDERAHLAELTGHSHASQVAHLAKQAGVGRLILMHVDPTLDVEDPIGLPSIQAFFPNAQLAFDGMNIEITGKEPS